jgi:uncharacterized membrane protein
LGGVEAEKFPHTVAGVPPDHFAAEDVPLLTAYCRAAALERRAAEELVVGATIGSQPSPWLSIYTSAVRSLAALSVRRSPAPG